jgi:S1-C subfamily serine protease
LTPPHSSFQTAGEREAGSICAHCHALVAVGNPIILCSACGTVHHHACWHTAGGCGSYVCAPPRRDLSQAGTDALKISLTDLDRASPLPERRPLLPPAMSPRLAQPRRMSWLAIVAAICAGLTLPFPLLALFHVAYVPVIGVGAGIITIVLGCIALSAISGKGQKGLLPALASVLVGLGVVVFLVIFMAHTLGDGGLELASVKFRPDLNAFDDLSPNINRAMRANVLIQTKPGFLGQASLGSGVILKIEDGEALVITNRHVVDPKFSADPPGEAGGEPNNLFVDVMMVDQLMPQGRVVWLAPGKVDLALVRVPCRSPQVKAARWKMRRRMRVGEDVFAIGNPQGLGWTHTKGTISQFRIQDAGGRDVRVIQTQTALNPGNSGGGLYDSDGYLIGINTWAQDKRVSEGLNFAVSLDTLLKVSPPGLDLEAGSDGEN